MSFVAGVGAVMTGRPPVLVVISSQAVKQSESWVMTVTDERCGLTGSSNLCMQSGYLNFSEHIWKLKLYHELPVATLASTVVVLPWCLKLSIFWHIIISGILLWFSYFLVPFLFDPFQDVPTFWYVFIWVMRHTHADWWLVYKFNVPMVQLVKAAGSIPAAWTAGPMMDCSIGAASSSELMLALSSSWNESLKSVSAKSSNKSPKEKAPHSCS